LGDIEDEGFAPEQAGRGGRDGRDDADVRDGKGIDVNAL
jgi:hypothetical protein